VTGRHLVTGAAGLIGFELARQLLARGDEVVAADRFLKGGREDLATLARRHPGALRVVETDLADPDGTKPIEGRYDAVFHFAAIVGVQYVNEHPWETIEQNLRSTLNVFELAIRHGCGSSAFASSSENYACGVEQGTVRLPTPEDVVLSIGDVALPRWSYAASKIAGESALFAAAAKGGFCPQVVRFHNTYGPRMGPTHVIPELLERCRRKVDPFPVHGYDQTRSFVHVEDAVRAVIEVALGRGRGAGGIYNVGSDVETRISDLVALVFDITGHRPKLQTLPTPPGSVSRRVPDIRKIRALGFEPRIGLREGVASCWTGAAGV
jgi:UDP-glucose 4-epimerase/UDP-glucuronate decarboxylase